MSPSKTSSGASPSREYTYVYFYSDILLWDSKIPSLSHPSLAKHDTEPFY
jgi:hypothetical protein